MGDDFLKRSEAVQTNLSSGQTQRAVRSCCPFEEVAHTSAPWYVMSPCPPLVSSLRLLFLRVAYSQFLKR
jgi:hypothetical protein